MAKDFLLNDGDLQIKDGDFVIGYSDDQHIEHLLLAHVGEYTQFPLIGIGVSDYLLSPLNGTIRQQMERTIRQQIQADGGNNIKVKIDNQGTINVTADYAD